MVWCALLILAAAPVGPETSGVEFEQALAAVDGVDDVTGLARAVQARREGQYRSFFTSNPQLTVQPALRAEAGVARPEGMITLSQTLNLGGLGAARAAVQQDDLELAALEHQLVRQERRLAVIDAWVALWAAQESSRLAHEEEQNVRELLARLERASTTGATTRVEVATSRAFAAELAALHLEWEGRRVEAGAALAELLGLPTPAAAIGPLPSPAQPELTALTPERQLPVRLSERELLGEQARLEESIAQWGTQLQVSIQGAHEAPTQWVAAAGVGLTFPLIEQGRRERTAHQANLAKLTGARGVVERRARVRIQLVLHELEHTAETLRVLSEEQLPAAEEAVALETRRFAQGEATLLELTLLRRQALAARISTAQARARFVAARARAKELEVQP